MKKTKRLAALIMAMMCLFGLLAGLPVSAAAISADTALTASMAAANPNVQLTPDGDSFEMKITNDAMMEVQLVWTVEVDVKKTPYWILQTQSIWVGNSPTVLVSAGDVFMGIMEINGYLVVDLRKVAKNGVFKGNLSLLYQDYYFSKMKQGRSVTKMAHWISRSADLNGKVTANNRIPSVDYQTLVDSEKVFKVSEGVKSSNLVLEPVDDYGFDMQVDPDQELETYGNVASLSFFAYVDIDKTPFIHVDLAELEISFVGVINVLDPVNGPTMRGRCLEYITGGNSGVVTYDMRKIIGKGKQYIKFSACIDDGFNAEGAVNYLRYVWIDNKENAASPSIAASNTTAKPVTTAPATTTAAPSEADPAQSEEAVSNEEFSADSVSEISGEPDSSAVVSDVQTDVSDSNEKPDNGFPVGVVVAIIVAVVLIGGGIAAFLILKKKKSAVPNEQA